MEKDMCKVLEDGVSKIITKELLEKAVKCGLLDNIVAEKVIKKFYT